jgi:hypothetical protein
LNQFGRLLLGDSMNNLSETLTILQHAGIAFAYQRPDGWMTNLNPIQVISLVNDRNDLNGSLLGISKEDYLYWESFDGKCQATTTKGVPCKNYAIFQGFGGGTPDRLIRGIHDYCFNHKGERHE